MQTVYQIQPETEECNKWIEENVCYEDWQRMGDILTVEHRFANELLNGLIGAGFDMGEDFQVF